MLKKTIVCFCFIAAELYASGGKSGTPETTAPNSAEVLISKEIAPAGGTVQVKFSTTSPQPIMSGGTGFDGFAVDGVALTSPLGDAAGIALQQGSTIQIFPLSPSGDLGTGDYPFLTVTMTLPLTLPPGTVVPIDLTPGTTLFNAAGPIAVTTKPGSITAGGTFSISEVQPGGGNLPGGAVVRILGQGFQPNSGLRTVGFNFASYKVVSPTEIDVILKEQSTLDNTSVQVSSSGITQTFFCYLRGHYLQPPTRTLLQSVDPAFQRLTHALAQAGPFLAQAPGQYVALALQNPNPGPAAVTLTLTHADGSTTSNLIVLPSGTRIMDDVAALTGAGSVAAGDMLNLSSTAAIQILGVNADETAGTATPFLPAF
ncbi:MAG TPA: hypothetical protein VNH18_20740 [Bryobacteraceae bacterium]|nr:hypothetical protein [Bryobacteraceae bacterium]